MRFFQVHYGHIAQHSRSLFTPFKLAFGMEAITPVEYVVPSLRLAVQERLMPEDSLAYRLDAIAVLDEDRLRSFSGYKSYSNAVKGRRMRFPKHQNLLRGI